MGYNNIMFIIKGEIKNDVTSYRYDPDTKRIIITYGNVKR